MKKALKWIGIVVGGLVGLLIVAVVVLYVVSSFRINATYDDIQAESIEIPTDEESIAWGEHVFAIRGCVDCHTDNLGGAPFIEDPAMGSLQASNLTSGNGGIANEYTTEDWVRAIRHGVGPDGKPLLFMPSHEFYFLSDEDLGAMIAYIKSVPPVDNDLPENSVGPLGRALFLAGEFPLLPVELIDHDAPRPEPEPGVTLEYGEYLAVGCTGCHGPGFSGGPIPGVPPEWPPAANITPGGNPGNWTEAEFIETMRTGLTPEGKQLNAEYMPWPNFAQMTDEELQALWLYLQSLPAKATGNR